ncbi:hypothetical protein CRE_02779 [Caenorhabditis remanei]|uniref:Nuclear receptor domain-containing protein n=1 Tax=Caenorhabditis remanei TaxID=31234 RepID=E3NUD0_CAERE|nr:hypothetical protein CRE_02779 [Caenorhabditis remanei]
MDPLDNVINAVASQAQLSVNVINAVVSPAQLLDNVIDSVVSPKPPVEKPVRYCLICGDKSSGCHYGALTCEGCKKFFCRAYDKEYQCRYKTPCAITPKTRNDCKACRLKKCREVGMHKQSREYSGQSFKKSFFKKINFRASETSQQPPTTNRHHSTISAPSHQQRISATSQQPPTTNRPHSTMMMMTIKDVELIQYLLKARNVSADTVTHKTIPRAVTDHTELSTLFNESTRHQIRHPVTRNVPISTTYPRRQNHSLKRHAFSIYLVRSAPAFTDCGFLLKNGGIIAWERFHKLFYGGLGIKMKSFATAIELMHFSEAELGVFLMLIMLQPILMKDVVKTGFDNVFMLIENYALISRTLYYKLSTRDQEERLFDRIQGLLEQVNTINNLHNQTLDLIRKNLICFSVPRLFSEIFGIPRTVLDEEVAEHIRRIKESQDFLKSRGLLNIL